MVIGVLRPALAPGVGVVAGFVGGGGGAGRPGRRLVAGAIGLLAAAPGHRGQHHDDHDGDRGDGCAEDESNPRRPPVSLRSVSFRRKPVRKPPLVGPSISAVPSSHTRPRPARTANRHPCEACRPVRRGGLAPHIATFRADEPRNRHVRLTMTDVQAGALAIHRDVQAPASIGSIGSIGSYDPCRCAVPMEEAPLARGLPVQDIRVWSSPQTVGCRSGA